MDKKKIHTQRVGIVLLKLVKGSSVLYETRVISNPHDAYKLIKNFLIYSDREQFVVACLDTKINL
ncbi:JAB domain-containing protein [Clostridioides sp. ES-S-0108-01]|uniref:JAB domain-containing protein n=1 Tax=Clostridioides sp. ES-S-0108-01 TaxID=2770773 RepID=UPI001D0BF8E3